MQFRIPFYFGKVIKLQMLWLIMVFGFRFGMVGFSSTIYYEFLQSGCFWLSTIIVFLVFLFVRLRWYKKKKKKAQRVITCFFFLSPERDLVLACVNSTKQPKKTFLFQILYELFALKPFLPLKSVMIETPPSIYLQRKVSNCGDQTS